MYIHTPASFPGPLLERVLRTTFDPRGLGFYGFKGHASTSRAGESLGTRLHTLSFSSIEEYVYVHASMYHSIEVSTSLYNAGALAGIVTAAVVGIIAPLGLCVCVCVFIRVRNRKRIRGILKVHVHLYLKHLCTCTVCICRCSYVLCFVWPQRIHKNMVVSYFLEH